MADWDKAEASLKPGPDPAQAELLVRLLIRHQDELFRYIFSLLPHREDARDVLQETCVALYRKGSSYDPSKPFLAWAYGFAYLQVLKHRERTRGTLHLRDELIEQLARERPDQEANLHERLIALETCLASLPPADRQLIHDRYSGGCSIEDLVTRSGSSRRTLFRNLDRIRRLLFECINRRIGVATT